MNTQDYRNAPSGIGPQADQWKDKPHRLVYDLCTYIEATNNPDLDGTDFAHPAYWRGHDQAVRAVCQKINEILDGHDDGHGIVREPWESTRRRLLSIA